MFEPTLKRYLHAPTTGDQLPAIPFGAKVTAIAAGDQHACALFADGSVKCWGYNYYGQLGLNDTTDRGGKPGEMVSLPSVYLGAPATKIAAGGHTSCAILTGGALKCWGYNGSGQLGQGDVATRGNKPGDMGTLLPIELGAGGTVLAVDVGGEHVCAVLGDGRLKCWGAGSYGRLGLGSSASWGNKPGDMGNALSAVDLGTDQKALGVACAGVSGGAGHNCALLSDGTIKCWGYNGYGQLGQGDVLTRGDAPNEMGDKLPRPLLLSTLW